jgi:hypothetical protein
MGIVGVMERIWSIGKMSEETKERNVIEHYAEMNPITKALLAGVGTVLTTLAISTWNTVQTSNVEIVRLQARFDAVNGEIKNSQNAYSLRMDSLEKRLDKLEGRN